MIDEVYQPLLRGGETIAAVVDDDARWFDIGTPRRYLSAMQELLAGSGTHSTIGEGSVVRGEIVGTAVWNDCVIGENARLERCIVGHGVTIPDGAVYSDALLCADSDAIPADWLGERRDGLVIAPI
jgi:NDP-sugar pyrophosphorylase family protein